MGRDSSDIEIRGILEESSCDKNVTVFEPHRGAVISTSATVPPVRASAPRLGLTSAGKRIVVSLAQFCGCLLLLWGVFFALYKAFPYIRSGADLVYTDKTQLLDHSMNAEVVIFGNSKVLSGFKPRVYDQVTGLRSFNLGLPDERRFISNLERIVAHGRAPQDVLLTLTESEKPHATTPFHYLEDDRAIMERLFPFRHFIRDLTLFLLRSRTRGGPVAFYRQGPRILAQMESDRGYYFIEGQRLYADNRLPADFHLSTDRPSLVNARKPLSAGDLRRLCSIAERFNMTIWLVPSVYRIGEYAPPPAVNAELAAMVRTNPHLRLAGPDYWIFPVDCFSDGVHLNPHGAEIYTRRLAELLASQVR